MRKNDLVKQLRKKAGLTQNDFASLLGTNQAYVSALETRSNFSIKTANQIGKILKVEGRSLMIDDDGAVLEINKEQVIKNVVAFLKRKDIKIVDLIKQMKISRNTFYYQLKSDDIKQSFKDSFMNACGFNLMDIVNENKF